MAEEKQEEKEEIKDAQGRDVLAGSRKVLRRASVDFWSLMERPEYLVVIIGLLFGLLILSFTPPGQACDEPQHINNSYRLSMGVIVPKTKNGTSGTDLPVSFVETEQRVGVDRLMVTGEGKEHPTDLASSFSIPLKAGTTTFVDSYLQYPPLCYVPQAVGMTIGHVFGGPPILLIYLARLFNLLAVLIIAFLTIRITPVLKWTFFLLFLMPMTLFQSSSCSADAMTIAFSFLATAYFFRLAFDKKKEKIERADIIGLLAISLALALIKMPYFLLVFGFFLIPWRKFGNWKKYVLTFAVMLLIIIVFAGAWQVFVVKHSAGWSGPQFVPGKALKDVIRHPLSFMRMEYQRLGARQLYLPEMVGYVGWWNITPPWWLWPSFLFMLIAVTALDKDETLVSRWYRAYSVLIFLVTAAAVIVILHITMDPLHSTFANAKDYINGRYFIPPLAFGFLLFYNKSIKYRKTRFFYVIVTLLAIFFCVTTVVMITHRFY